MEPTVAKGRCLLVTALKHPDPLRATAMAAALIAAGVSWRDPSSVSALALIRRRRLVGVLPSLIRARRLTQAPLRDHEGFFLAGLFAVDGWSEGLRALASLGVDIRHGVDERAYHLSKKIRGRPRLRYWLTPYKKDHLDGTQRMGVVSTLRVWLARPPLDSALSWTEWVETAAWLMETPPPSSRREQEQAGLACELAALSVLERYGQKRSFRRLERTWMASPHWWSDAAGRQAAAWYASMGAMRPGREAAQWRRFAQLKVRAIVAQNRLSLDSTADVHSRSSVLYFALQACRNLAHRPRLLKQSVEWVAWAVQKGANHRETTEFRGVRQPVWLDIFQCSDLPWAVLEPLRAAGWNPLDLISVAVVDPRSDDGWKLRSLPLAHALRTTNLLGLQHYLQEFPQEVHRRDFDGRNFLLHSMHSMQQLFFYSHEETVVEQAVSLIKIFLSFGGDIRATDDRGDHVLHTILSNPHLRLQDHEALLVWAWERFPALFDVPNTQGVTAWDLLATDVFQDSSVAQSLLKAVALNQRLPGTASTRSLGMRF